MVVWPFVVVVADKAAIDCPCNSFGLALNGMGIELEAQFYRRHQSSDFAEDFRCPAGALQRPRHLFGSTSGSSSAFGF